MVEAAEGSPLSRVFERIAERRAAVYKDIRVDGLSDHVGEDVYVRYAAKIGGDEFARRTAKLRSDSPALELYLTTLVELCHGVFSVRDGKKVGLSAAAATDPDGWPRFDDELRAVLAPAFPLGITNSAARIARALFEAGHNPENVLQAHAEIGRHYRDLNRWIAGDDPLGGDDGLGG
jgi:hypothetical protein